MLHIASGREIGRLLEQVCGRVGDYRSVVLASPYIDEVGRELIDEFYQATIRSSMRCDVVTTPLVEATCTTRWPAHKGFRLHALRGLHAKVYVALAHRPTDHVAIVSSANLTRAGLKANVECGLRVSGSTRTMVSLIERIPLRVGIHTQLGLSRT